MSKGVPVESNCSCIIGTRASPRASVDRGVAVGEGEGGGVCSTMEPMPVMGNGLSVISYRLLS